MLGEMGDSRESIYFELENNELDPKQFYETNVFYKKNLNLDFKFVM